MKLEKRIELCDSMTPLESEIASYILNNKDAVTKLKIQELADILFISKSAIHRFVKKIGFNGFLLIYNRVVDKSFIYGYI